MRTQLFISCMISLFMIGSCTKKPSAGLGGNANLKVKAFHHSSTIDSCTIYIKFNTSEAVSLSEYDLSQKIVKDSIGNSYTIFAGLKKGDYYIYGEGWDRSISNNVKGGLPYTIKEESDLEIIIPVTETH